MKDLQDTLDRLAARVPIEDRLDDIVLDRKVVRLHTHTRRPRSLAVAAASVALITGAGALIAWRQVTPTEAPSADAPVATAVPPGVPQPLFMLPSNRTGELAGGQVSVVQFSTDGSVSVVGVRDGNGYRDLFTMTVSIGTIPIGPNTTIAQPGVEWKHIDLATGAAEVLERTGFPTSVIQQRGAYWLQVDGPSSEATRAMEAATVSNNGTLSLTAADLAILNTQTSAPSQRVGALYHTAGGTYVETVTATSVFAFNSTASAATPININDNPGWQLTETHSDGTTTVMLSWMETPDRNVMVYGSAQVDELLAVAEDLTVVDYRTWDQNVSTLAEQESTDTTTSDTAP